MRAPLWVQVSGGGAATPHFAPRAGFDAFRGLGVAGGLRATFGATRELRFALALALRALPAVVGRLGLADVLRVSFRGALRIGTVTRVYALGALQSRR